MLKAAASAWEHRSPSRGEQMGAARAERWQSIVDEQCINNAALVQLPNAAAHNAEREEVSIATAVSLPTLPPLTLKRRSYLTTVSANSIRSRFPANCLSSGCDSRPM